MFFLTRLFSKRYRQFWRRLEFSLAQPATGPYVGSPSLAIYDRVTGNPLVSFCLTPDGWDVKPKHFASGLYKLNGANDGQP